MAASMMMAEVGSSLNVMGMRSAVPAAGPRPGRTPINVPRTQPMVANKRFIGDKAAREPRHQMLKCLHASPP